MFITPDMLCGTAAAQSREWASFNWKAVSLMHKSPSPHVKAFSVVKDTEPSHYLPNVFITEIIVIFRKRQGPHRIIQISVSVLHQILTGLLRLQVFNQLLFSAENKDFASAICRSLKDISS